MLDIPELDDMVFRHLNERDLVLCAQVCKKWHSVITPRLWHDLRGLEKRHRRGRLLFRRLVQEDYLAEQRYQRLRKEGSAAGRSSQEPLSPPLSPLLKYGQWIRWLTDPHELYKLVMPVHTTAQDEGLDPVQLLLHFLRRCPPVVQVDYTIIYGHNLDSHPRSVGRAIMNFALPRVRRLHVQLRLPLPLSKVSRLTDLLDQCSHVLRILALQVVISSETGTDDVKADPTENEWKTWSSLEELILYEWRDTDTKMFWPWLFRRCGQVEKLGVPKVHGATQLLTHAMLMHMPRITEIAVGVSCETLVPIPEHEVATLLSGSSKGWKTVKLGECASFGRVVMEALAKHFSTLEALKLNGSSGRSGNDVIRILCSCPCLRSFIIIDSPSKLDTMVFVDQDPVTGVLRPWECETTLKELKIKIAGVSRASFQTYTRQGYDLESRLYDRLARLTNLEILWIGDYDNEHDRGHLEMSLESGLSKLSGLRLLRELNIEGLATRIRVKEVQWMVEKWPRLRTIYGLQAMEWDEIKTRQWVWEHHPEIELGPKWYQNLW